VLKQLKVLLYKTIVKPTLIYGNETLPITQRQEQRMEATEIRMLRRIHKINWEDHIRDEDIRSEAKVKPVSRHIRKRRLQWYGLVHRRDSEDDIRYVTELNILGKRKRGRPKQRWVGMIGDNMKRWGLKPEDVEDQERWRTLIESGSLQTGHPYRTTTVQVRKV